MCRGSSVVEQKPEELCVDGSIPSLGTIFYSQYNFLFFIFYFFISLIHFFLFFDYHFLFSLYIIMMQHNHLMTHN
jgi:hypothetical protein